MSWFGNDYYDQRRKKWITRGYSRRLRGRRVFWALVVCLVVAVGLSFIGVEPLASYKDVVVGKASPLIDGIREIEAESVRRPSGVYKCVVFGMEQTWTFKKNTVEYYDLVFGKHIYEYEVTDDGSQIVLTDVVSRESSVWMFSYVPEHDVVVLNRISYYR